MPVILVPQPVKFDDHIPERIPDAMTDMCKRVRAKKTSPIDDEEHGRYTGSAAINHSVHGASLRNMRAEYKAIMRGSRCDGG